VSMTWRAMSARSYLRKGADGRGRLFGGEILQPALEHEGEGADADVAAARDRCEAHGAAVHRGTERGEARGVRRALGAGIGSGEHHVGVEEAAPLPIERGLWCARLRAPCVD